MQMKPFDFMWGDKNGLVPIVSEQHQLVFSCTVFNTSIGLRNATKIEMNEPNTAEPLHGCSTRLSLTATNIAVAMILVAAS